MHANIALLISMSLLAGVNSLLSDHRRDPVKDEEAVTLVSGVPVYGYQKALVERGGSADTATNWILKVTPSGDAENNIQAACQNTVPGCNVIAKLSTGVFVAVESSGGQLADLLANLPGAVYGEVDQVSEVQNIHDDLSSYLIDEAIPDVRENWGLIAINRDNSQADGIAVHAYVYDTGVRTTHTQFTGRAIPTLDAVTGQLIVCSCQNTSCARDRHGHGTHCAGIIGGSTHGVAPKSRIHAVKVLDDSGNGYVSWQIMCHNWVAERAMRPAVASMSLGGSGRNEASKDAIDAVVAAGIPVVVAAGNSNADACDFTPAYVPSAITVGSTTRADERSYFSNFGTCLDIWAPGSDIVSAAHYSDDQFQTMSGTSMAAPFVAGAVAMLYEMHPTLNADLVITHVQAAALNGTISGIPREPPSVPYFLQVNTLPGYNPTMPPLSSDPTRPPA